jgi:transcriptional regulator with XRE-family HTH domain
MPNSRLGSLLAQLLSARGLSQVAFAAKVGVSQSFVSQVVKGRKRPSPMDAARWTQVLELDDRDRMAFLEEAAWAGAAQALWVWRERMEGRVADLENRLAGRPQSSGLD